MLTGFTYDGGYDYRRSDFLISRIGSTSGAGDNSWVNLKNGIIAAGSGCQSTVQPGESSGWQWNAFKLTSLLTITPQYEVVAPGDSVTITVLGRDLYGANEPSPIGGATLSGGQGRTSDANGVVTFTAPSLPGCYQYKATGSNMGRSNAYYLNVMGGFPATIG
jgi:hypothetical protein